MRAAQWAEMNDAAAAYVARMDSGSWSEADEAELQHWLAQNPMHAGALLQMQAAWMAPDMALADTEYAVEAPVQAASFLHSRRALLIGGGSALAASVASGVMWARSLQSYRTELGEVRRVPLADGSIVAINTMSKIDVNLNTARREIVLDKGQAWFQVAKDASRPFLVSAGRVRALAIGTAFAVRKQGQGAEIIVTEGVVEAWADEIEGSKVRLFAGMRVFIDETMASGQIIEEAAGDRSLAWRNGRIELAGTSLRDAAAEFNRYNKRQIIIGDPALGETQFDGIFSVNDPEGFALALQNSVNVVADLSDPMEIRIISRQ